MFLIYKGGKDFYQWDMGQRLQIVDENYNRVHFCTKNCTTALVCNVYTENGVRLVNVPNTLLQKPCIVKAYGCIAEGGEIYYAKEAQYFRVIERAKPDDYIYTEEELKNWNGIDERLAQIEEDVAELEAIGYDNLARKTEVQAVENRLDNAIAATTLDANAELIDIRVGANGESYTNAGNAVRAKVNKTDILSSFGDSEDKVVSQKAVSKKFNTLEGKVSKNEKQIANLINAREQELFIEDDTVAYVKEVPEKVLPYAEIGEVGGMSRKCENLIPFPYTEPSKTYVGVTYTVGEDGGVTLSGTPTGDSFFVLYDDAILASSSHTISLTGKLTNARMLVFLYDSNDTTLMSTSGNSVFIDTEKYSTAVREKILINRTTTGAACSGTAYIMANKGDTALPYEPYFEGLRDAKVTAVESVGANLIEPTKIVPSQPCGVDISYSDDGTSIILNGTSTTYSWVSIGKVELENDNYVMSGGISIAGVYIEGSTNTNYGGTTTILDVDKNATRSVGIHISAGNTYNNTVIKPQINKGETALPYSPYFKNTFPIPEAVQTLDGYGQGISKEYHNKIVLDPANGVKKFVKNVGVVDLGTLNWYLRGNQGNTFTADGTILGYKYGLNGLCVKYETSTRVDSDKTIFMYNSYLGNNIISITDTDYTDAATFKAAMNGVMLVYALATPTETDLSDYFGEDNLIGVEAGGTITAVNEYEYDVPSLITYQLKEV